MFRQTAIGAVAALSIAAAGCSSSGAGDTQAASKTLTLGVIQSATTFAAADMNFSHEAPYGQAVYDSLLRAEPDGKIVPWLATEWKYNDAKTVLDMTLRSDVTFTDGTKFNADAAAQNLKRFQAGASADKSKMTNLADAKAIDDTHLQVTLKQSDPAFLNYLTSSAGYQESPAAFTKADVKTVPVGSGPYTLDTAATVVGSVYTFNKNPNYWDKASQHYDKLALKVLTDPTAMLNAIKGKQLNGAVLVNNDAIDQVKAAGYIPNSYELNVAVMPLLDRAGTLNPALKDVRVRQAINYAFDRQALLQAFGKGFGTPTTQMFPPRSAGFDAALDSKYPYDPAKAKALLAEAGFPNGFTLALSSNPSYGTAVYALLTQLFKDVGITLQITEGGTKFIADILAAKYPVAFLRLQQDPTDWQMINFMITPTATWNPFKYADPKVNELVEKIHTAKTDAEAAPALKELNTYIVDQAWFAPWFRVVNHYATDANTQVKPQVGNIYPYLWNFTPKG